MWTRKTIASNGELLGIGERLRNAREARGYSLDAMERLTKVRTTYLRALEDERFDLLPERIYVRGFLRTYAVALGFNPQELLEIYDRAFVEPLGPIVGDRAVEIPIRPAVPRSRFRRILVFAVTVLGLVLIFLAYVGVQQVREFSQPVPPARPSAPPAPAPAPPAPAPAPPAPAPAPPTPAVSAPSPPSDIQPAPTQLAGVRLELKASGRSWVRVAGDGNLLFDGFVVAGDVRTWAAVKQLDVQIGLLSAVALAVNGRPVTLNSPDQVWKGTFTAGP